MSLFKKIFLHKGVLMFILVLSFTACSHHHACEKVVEDILVNVDSINHLISSHKNTKFYYNSVVKKNQVDVAQVWKKHLKKYQNGYVIMHQGSFFQKKYFKEINNKGQKVIEIEIKENEQAFGFSFIKKDGSWQLLGMGVIPETDIAID